MGHYGRLQAGSRPNVQIIRAYPLRCPSNRSDIRTSDLSLAIHGPGDESALQLVGPSCQKSTYARSFMLLTWKSAADHGRD